ncbi:hypothetical protein F511_16950 [Dorcoceras hygrometricum]|uniref:Uncharacterized protein n=1 Tax=Dorcoceras hygrometricum TaxID=472368 RepID=A0A2Z7D0I5_9LAMI|nr:hypothetical protein F511_16950 [Dorcoceras hygrometricum]
MEWSNIMITTDKDLDLDKADKDKRKDGRKGWPKVIWFSILLVVYIKYHASS